YLPYLRFKGNIFTCQGNRTDFRFVDITQLAVPFDGVPNSLGFRAQAMTLKFLDPAAQGLFFKPTLKLADILVKVSRLGSKPSGEVVHHRAHIGERTSLVYLPLYRRQDRLFDAVTNRPILTLPAGREIIPPFSAPPASWRLNILPTLCPVCGWHLEGEKDSAALVCRNCERVFETSSGRFAPVEHVIVAGSGEETTFLPFWRMTATSTTPPMQSFADFIRITRQPRIPPPEWEKMPLSFWCPAFRIRPKIFLQLLRTATMAQPPCPGSVSFGQKPLFPVTLPASEAAQSLKLALADLTIKKSDLFPLLPKTRFTVVRTTLAYLPFRDNGRELTQSGSSITIDKNALDFGRKL
ncbi:MAG: hypothetical protein GX751_09770, partial [Desulfuromonadaceae bacterium]|nr:hypothetical protein [Desulfuromonadaceae bacterium]